jgi:hypothetical protein
MKSNSELELNIAQHDCTNQSTHTLRKEVLEEDVKPTRIKRFVAIVEQQITSKNEVTALLD